MRAVFALIVQHNSLVVSRRPLRICEQLLRVRRKHIVYGLRAVLYWEHIPVKVIVVDLAPSPTSGMPSELLQLRLQSRSICQSPPTSNGGWLGRLW